MVTDGWPELSFTVGNAARARRQKAGAAAVTRK
jgi:hypothetical protein